MPTALVSVYDKSGVADLGTALAERGWTVVSTGGTARELKAAGVDVVGVSDLTGFPEILDGRVKTLHPNVHAGLLARRSVASDQQELEELGIAPIDLVAVNLYPFRETIAQPSTTLAQALAQIDIGGPTMLRAAAKNHDFVWPVCDPGDYAAVIEAIDSGDESGELRRHLAAKVFLHTANYDAAIARYLDAQTRPSAAGELPVEMLCSLVRVQELRYGENPDQAAAFYREASTTAWGIPGLRQLQGKELSYNNILDIDGALGAAAPFLGGSAAACVIVKHTTPCGLAVGRSATQAFTRARACDPVSAFGSTIVFNQPVTEDAAEAMSDLFVECLVAPGYSDDALRLLQKKKNLRVLVPGEGGDLGERRGHLAAGVEFRGVTGGVLLQTPAGPVDLDGFRDAADVSVPTDRQPDDGEWADIAFAWAAAQGVKSNAIVLAAAGATIGIGAGQMSRVDSVRLAVRKASDAGLDVRGSILSSDAFFPFRDGIDAAAAAGVETIVQPGGSIRDKEVIAAADEHGMTMVLTGRRLFRH
jgi:phosphoribosylaminoimidazolecarboxamide formyltransferase/IMP cyclohydrolase